MEEILVVEHLKKTFKLSKKQKTPQKIEVYNIHSIIYHNNNPKAC